MTPHPVPAATCSGHDPARGAALRAAVLIEAAELAAIAGNAGLTILAVRTSDAPSNPPQAAVERIAGAQDVDLASDLAGPGGGRAGSRPLPDVTHLQALARRWGIRSGSEVVVYDHDGGLQAARAWWVLRWAGIHDVRLLNGGFGAWQAAGLPTVQVCIEPQPGDVTLSAGHLPELDADAAERLARSGVLLDSRITPNYEGGDSAAGELKRGHIPGAVSVPAAANLDATGRFLDGTALRALYAAVGADGTRPVGVYCGAGVSAAHNLLALASIGIEAPMYVGSWSAWSADPARPSARGSLPG